MEEEIVTLKKELEGTKSALKLQSIRCRQLLAAFTKKLQEKEFELRCSKDLRDQQLSCLLRALLILESRLRKEQKNISKQLHEKDSVIQSQQREIVDLKEKKDTQDVGTWTGDEMGIEVLSVQPANDLWVKQNGEDRLDDLCKSNTSRYVFDIDHYRNENDKERNSYKDNPVLECVNQILLRDEEELLKPNCKTETSVFLIGKDNVDCKPQTEWYETDNSLTVQEGESGEAWCISVVEEEIPSDKVRKPSKTECKVKQTSPVPKAQHLEEKVCLEMAKKHLTVVRNSELEDVDPKQNQPPSPNPTEQSYQEIIPKNSTYIPVRNLQKPPALPPKPAVLLKPHQVLANKMKQELVTQQQVRPTNQPSMKTSMSESSLSNYQSTANITLKTNGNQPVSTNHKHPPAVLSRKSQSTGVLKSTKHPHFDHNSNVKIHQQEIQRNQMNGHIPGNLKVQEKLHTQKVEDALCGAIRVGSSVSSLIIGYNGESIVTELMTNDDKSSSHVSAMVKQFEVLSTKPEEKSEEETNDIRKNFEEFNLEESYADSKDEDGRLEGDGAETRNIINHYATIAPLPPPIPSKQEPPAKEPENRTYEAFLETTGLSQKSILTPSRLLSNHRSCLKPKDVKHRNRIKAAVNNSGPTVKYWTEPFL